MHDSCTVVKMGEQVCVRLSDSEAKFLEKVANYLYATKRIEKNNKQAAFRYAVFNVVGPLILEEIKMRREEVD